MVVTVTDIPGGGGGLAGCELPAIENEKVDMTLTCI